MTTTQIKYCHCKFEFSDARVERGPGRWSNDEVWVCNKCDGLHHVRQVWHMPRTVRRAPRNAVAFLSTYGDSFGVTHLNYSLTDGTKAMILSIHTHNRRPDTMPIQPTDLLLGVWERLDYYTALVMEAEPADVDLAKDRAKAGARAIAEVLAPMMVPFFTDADSIVREAVERYKHRLDTEYETPGLGQKSLAPHDKMPMQTAPVKTAPAVNLTEKEQAAIKMALESKMFTAEQLAKSYNVPVAAIKALASN